MSFPEGLSEKANWVIKYGLDETRDKFGLSPDKAKLGNLHKLIIELGTNPKNAVEPRTRELDPDKFYQFNQTTINHEAVISFMFAMTRNKQDILFQTPVRFLDSHPNFSLVAEDNKVYTFSNSEEETRLIEQYILIHEAAKVLGMTRTFGAVQRMDGAQEVVKYFIPESDEDSAKNEQNKQQSSSIWSLDSSRMISQGNESPELYLFNYASGESALGLSVGSRHSVLLTDQDEAERARSLFNSNSFAQIPFKKQEVA